MALVSPVPDGVEYFLDTRGDERALRVRWHDEADVVVLSMWRGGDCVASFRLGVEEVPELIGALRAGLDRAYADAAARQEARPVTRWWLDDDDRPSGA